MSNITPPPFSATKTGVVDTIFKTWRHCSQMLVWSLMPTPTTLFEVDTILIIPAVQAVFPHSLSIQFSLINSLVHPGL